MSISEDNPICFLRKKLFLKSVDINIAFVQTRSGVLKVVHTFLGVICLILISLSCQYVNPLTSHSIGFLCSNTAVYFLLVTYGCFVTSFTLLICCLSSYFTSSFLPKTTFELTYHALAFILYLTASVMLLVTLVSSNSSKKQYNNPNYEMIFAASILGLVNSLLYCGSAFFSFQALKQLG